MTCACAVLCFSPHFKATLLGSSSSTLRFSTMYIDSLQFLAFNRETNGSATLCGSAAQRSVLRCGGSAPLWQRRSTLLRSVLCCLMRIQLLQKSKERHCLYACANAPHANVERWWRAWCAGSQKIAASRTGGNAPGLCTLWCDLAWWGSPCSLCWGRQPLRHFLAPLCKMITLPAQAAAPHCDQNMNFNLSWERRTRECKWFKGNQNQMGF